MPHALRALKEVERLQARGGGPQGALPVRSLAAAPRLADRPAELRAHRRHVPLHVRQSDRLRRQALEVQPPQMINKQVGVRPVRAALAPAQESIRYPADLATRTHDRVTPSAVATDNLLNPNVTQDRPTSQPTTPNSIGAYITNIAIVIS
jgi:hypothetical protein